jgi:hypothetical protein
MVTKGRDAGEAWAMRLLTSEMTFLESSCASMLVMNACNAIDFSILSRRVVGSLKPDGKEGIEIRIHGPVQKPLLIFLNSMIKGTLR